MATETTPPPVAARRRSPSARSPSACGRCRRRGSGASSTSWRRWTTSSAWASASRTSTRRRASSRPASPACAAAGPTTPATTGRSSCAGRCRAHLERRYDVAYDPTTRDPDHRRCVGGGRPGPPGDLRPGRRGDPPRAFVRRLRARDPSSPAATSVHVSTTLEDDFALDPAARRGGRSRRGPRRSSSAIRATRPGPSCPTRSRTQLAEIAVRHDLLVYSDEIYDRLAYGSYRHRAMSSLPGMRERTILMGGFSKAYAMTGWRVGWLCAPAAILEGIVKVHQYGIMSAPTTAQDAAARGADDGEADVAADARGLRPPAAPDRRRPQRDRPADVRAARRVLRLPEDRPRPASTSRRSPSAC